MLLLEAKKNLPEHGRYDLLVGDGLNALLFHELLLNLPARQRLQQHLCVWRG